MRLDRAWIEGHIPHQGRMCLLDEVIVWTAERISCRSGTHRAADHPLRAHGRLGIACGIEYAAQAMAVHGALTGAALDGALDMTARFDSAPMHDVPIARTPVAGYLASVRGVQFHVLRLDEVQGDLICDATRVVGDRGTALYEFELRSETACLLSGRATVVFDANKRLHL
jgi:predicted hotdog family 3-hydroxylacyl-ACP dehydratase